MTPLFLQLATAVVLLVADDRVSIGGTCFAFNDPCVFLTAAHCVPPDAHVIVLQGRDTQRPAVAIERHPSCDVALIRVAEADTPYNRLSMINSVPDDIVWGGDFLTYGYPVEGVPDAQATGRLLKGHFQRYFSYTSSSGQTYWAGEMSVPTPAGHSGSPVVRAHAPQILEAIVTANYESYIVLDSIDEMEENGQRLRIESRRTVTYRVAMMATNFKPWLSELGVL